MSVFDMQVAWTGIEKLSMKMKTIHVIKWNKNGTSLFLIMSYWSSLRRADLNTFDCSSPRAQWVERVQLLNTYQSPGVWLGCISMIAIHPDSFWVLKQRNHEKNPEVMSNLFKTDNVKILTTPSNLAKCKCFFSLQISCIGNQFIILEPSQKLGL